VSQLDALRLIQALQRRLVDFSLDESFVRDESLRRVLRSVWESSPDRGGLLSDIWVEAAFGSESVCDRPRNLEELAAAGEFDAELVAQLDSRGAVPKGRTLYSHQREAIRAARSRPGEPRPGVMVTAGTGAGKTESFLLPLLDDLWRTPRGPQDRGVRCIILYPMNALVNDQVDRLYRWLLGQRRLSLVHFTSETPENAKAANRIGVPKWDACRCRTRSEARGLETGDGKPISPTERCAVPDILITNYSMLEYMLCRPQDAVFFGSALRTVVLDEAHLYTGTLAAEIAMLLRRVLVRCGRSSDEVLQIGTSATLGAGDIVALGADLFSKSQNHIRVIRGRRKMPELAIDLNPAPSPLPAAVRDTLAALSTRPTPTLEMNSEGEAALAVNMGLCEELLPFLGELSTSVAGRAALDSAKGRPAILLHRALSASDATRRLASILWESQRISLDELSRRLWGHTDETSRKATVVLLRLTASARVDASSLPLVPHRLHVLCRAPDGVCVCLNPACSAPADLKPSGWGALSTGFTETCDHCGGSTLSVVRCVSCGEAAIAGIMDEELRLRPIPPDRFRADDSSDADHLDGARLYSFQQPTGGPHNQEHLDLKSGEVTSAGANTRALDRIDDDGTGLCPRCRSSLVDAESTFEPIFGRSSLALSVVAETVLAGMPEHPSGGRAYLPARGRRLLTFTDSRQDAARLGPRLTNQHEVQLIRAAMSRVVHGLERDDATDEYLRARVADLEKRIPAAADRLRATLSAELARIQESLVGAELGMSVQELADSVGILDSAAELIDANSSEGHDHRPDAPWSAEAWRENARQARSSLVRLICEELATPMRPHRTGTAEAAALLEIVLPHVEKLSPGLAGPLSESEPMQDLVRVFAQLPGELAAELRRDWVAFVTELVLDLRRNMAITLGLGDDVDEDFALSRVGTSAVAGLYIDRDAFTGGSERATRTARVAALLRAGGVPAERASTLAVDLLGRLFDLLSFSRTGPAQAGPFNWVETNGEGHIRLNLSKVRVRKPPRVFRSDSTGLLYTRTVGGTGLLSDASTLREVSASEADASPRVARRRRELLGSDPTTASIFATGLWAEEHSAQLSPRENLQLQNLFRAGARNILSSTTTLELGIDIGGLAGVMLTSVPPGVANYAQRAGRAGRRADGSSIVVTYAQPRPFDREVFKRFGWFLEQKPLTPRVFLDRSRVIIRHVNAFLLGEFFREVYPPDARVGAMAAFRFMAEFCGLSKSQNWDAKLGSTAPDVLNCLAVDPPVSPPRWWQSNETARSLRDLFRSFVESVASDNAEPRRGAILSLLQGTPLAQLGPAGSSAFSKFILETNERLESADREWRATYSDLLENWKRSLSDEDGGPMVANALHRNLEALSSTTTIEALADAQFLPRYGFPIGLQRLSVWVDDPKHPMDVREEDRFRLDRSGMLALREYAPGATLVAGGKVVRCQGLLKHWTGIDKPETLGLRGRGVIASEGRFTYRIGGDTSPSEFPSTGEPTRGGHPFQLLFPRHGFSSAWWDKPTRSRSLRDPVGSVQLASSAVIDAPQWDAESFDFAGLRGLSARYREGGELLVYNPGNRSINERGEQRFSGFAVCIRCGFAKLEDGFDGDGRMNLPAKFEKHKPLRRKERDLLCWGRVEGAPVLRHQVLAARETTDLLVLAFGGPASIPDVRVAKTLAEGLKLAGARCLQLDPRELGSRFHPTNAGFAIVLFDAHPGGAGHVLELMGLGATWARAELRQVLYVSEEHHMRCQTACLDCLRTFGGGSDYDGVEFDRRRALEWLEAIPEPPLRG
jgi:hypothetical protein